MLEWFKDYEIICGTYESYILGYKYGDDLKLCPTFQDRAHSESVRSLATHGKYLITAGSDENVKIFNLRRRKEVGNLHHSDGIVNVLHFFDAKHLLTGSEDARICILKTEGNWRVEKTLLKHAGGVIDMALHPSGKLLLSIARDKKLITWNLIKGRSAYVTNIKETAEFVTWSPEGNYYVIGFYKRADVYDLASASVVYTVDIQGGGRANRAVFIENNVFALAAENKNIEIHRINKDGGGEKINSIEAHDVRVRSLQCIKEEKDVVLVSSSNDGFIKVWRHMKVEDGEECWNFELFTQVNTNCRITCLKVHKVPEMSKEEIPKMDPIPDPKELLKEVKERKQKLIIEEEKDQQPQNKKQKLNNSSKKKKKKKIIAN